MAKLKQSKEVAPSITYDTMKVSTASLDWYSTNNIWISTSASATITSGYEYLRLPTTGNTIQWTTQWLGGWEVEAAPLSVKPAISQERLQVINKKAKELLLQHLSEFQRQTWLAKQYFDVLTPSGRRYRLTGKQAHNVFLLDMQGKQVREYCAYAKDPGGQLPLEDHLFAQLMTLMFDEQEFLAKANVWDLLNKRTFCGQGVDVGLITPLRDAA